MSTQNIRNDGIDFEITVRAQISRTGNAVKPAVVLAKGSVYPFSIDRSVKEYFLVAEFDALHLSTSLIFEPDKTHDFRVFNSWVRVVGNKARHITHLVRIGNKDEDLLPPDDGGYKPPPPNP